MDFINDLNIDNEVAAMVSSALILFVAGIYLATAAGVRWGHLVWTGYRPGRLLPDKRVRSWIYGTILLLSAASLLIIGGVWDNLIPSNLNQSVGFTTAAFLAVSGLLSLVKGSKWERMFFAPILLFGAFVSAYITFF